jgi:hypothetical protein
MWRVIDGAISVIARLGTYLMLGGATVILGLFGGLWWLDSRASWPQGFFPVLILWGLAFNKLPTQGRRCLEDKFKMRFVVPVAVLSSIGFVAGLLQRHASVRPTFFDP